MTVSIHAPARGATWVRVPGSCPFKRFNPRPRAGGDEYHFSKYVLNLPFQSTPPRGGRLYAVCGVRRQCLFQSTPPRGGRRVSASPCSRRSFVSIHAPARGATYPDSHLSWQIFCFNPRPRAGGDKHGTATYMASISVSIHAPARGATPDNREGDRP